MIDVATQKPVRVTAVPSVGGGLIDLSVAQLPAVKQVLDANQVRYWVHHMELSINGGPALTTVQISRREDPSAVQALLDAA